MLFISSPFVRQPTLGHNGHNEVMDTMGPTRNVPQWGGGDGPAPASARAAATTCGPRPTAARNVVTLSVDDQRVV